MKTWSSLRAVGPTLRGVVPTGRSRAGSWGEIKAGPAPAEPWRSRVLWARISTENILKCQVIPPPHKDTVHVP